MDKNALIAQAREVAAAVPDSCQLLQKLADLVGQADAELVRLGQRMTVLLGSANQRADELAAKCDHLEEALRHHPADRDLYDARARVIRLESELAILRAGIAAYRSGSYTLAQVWENGDGKQVPR